VLTDDFVLLDRRRTGLAQFDGVDAYLASVAAYYELSPDARFEVLHYASIAPHGFVGLNRWSGTNTEGGGFESVFVGLSLCRGERVCRVELFEPDDLETALARFEGFCAAAGSAGPA
jgi:hypothetical protein